MDGLPGEYFVKISMMIAFSLLVTSFSFAADDHIFKAKENRVRLPIPATLTPGIFQQNIDHSGQLSGQTFDQRYWVDSSSAPPASLAKTAPVIFHICGEGDVDDSYFLHDNAIEWAKALGAHLVYLEHRYYGKSIPFSDFSAEHMKYLTLDNEIEDLATFQKWISSTQGWTGKWVTVGGSYSGTISAIYRYVHPELVSGALASSAPMIPGVGSPEGTQDDVDSMSYTDASNNSGERPWVYQSCTTFGFWMADGPNPGANLFYPSSWLCQQLFGNAPIVNNEIYNQKYDLPYISNSADAPSNILFTYGSNDIWTKIGLTQQPNANPKITIKIINGAVHHFDLNAPTSSDSAEVKEARAAFLSLAQEWIK